MTESILKQEEIAQYIADLRADVDALKAKARLAERESDLDGGEPPQDTGGGVAFTQGDHLVPVCRVTTIIDDLNFGALRQVPADGNPGWTDDTELTQLLSVRIPPTLSLPNVDDLVQCLFTGNFQDTSGSTITIPRYGLFGAGGGEVQQYLVREEFDDYLRCRTWVASVQGSEDVFIAKPFHNRRTPFDGVSAGGRSYVYSAPDQRTVTLIPSVAPGQEDQSIVPEYQFAGPLTSVIYGVRLKNPTDVVVTIGGTPTNLDVLDLNVDGRAWVGQTL